MLSLPVWLKSPWRGKKRCTYNCLGKDETLSAVFLNSPWRGSDPQFAVQIRVHRRLMQLQFLAASAPLRETFPLSIEPVLSLPKGWIGEEAAGRRGEASPCFPWRPGDWPEGFIPCPAYGLPVQTF